MVGSVYRHSDDFGERALPAEYDRNHIFIERLGYLKSVEYDENGEMAEMEDFGSLMNLEVGPDGTLYLIEEQSGVYRIEATADDGSTDNGGGEDAEDSVRRPE